jgi:cold-inducible RNA-binding protein
MKRLFVGNLPFSATEESLREIFGPFGEVGEVRIMTDRDTGKSRGFAFVEMVQDEDAAKAVDGLNGKDMGGRALTVNEARPRPERTGGGGGGFGGKRRGGGGGGHRDHERGGGHRGDREPRW